MSSYEELRKKNIEDNKRILAEIGIRNPFKPLPTVRKQLIKRKRSSTAPGEIVKRRRIEVVEGDIGTEYSSGRRRSTRLKGIKAPEIQEIQDDIDKETNEEKLRKKSLADRPMIYGAVPGVEVGMWWATRIECNHANIHRPTVAGIHPGPEGAYSIALSGGYEDDIDMGDCFTYTGEGGRDLKGTANNPKNLRTAPQSCDQKLSRGNAALVKSVETKKPVRVIRGYKLPSPFAPEEGYRYDGLYLVERFWYTTGMAGFGVFKFALRRLTDQAPPPWDIMDNLSESFTYKNHKNNDSNNNSEIKVTHDRSKNSNRICNPANSNNETDCHSDAMNISAMSNDDNVVNTRSDKVDDNSKINKFDDKRTADKVGDNDSSDKIDDSSGIDKVGGNNSTEKVDDKSNIDKSYDKRSADKVGDISSIDKVDDNSSINRIDDNNSTEKVDDNSGIDKVDDNSSINRIDDNNSTEKVDDNSGIDKVDDNSNINRVNDNNSTEKVDDNSGINKVDDNNSTEKVDDNSGIYKVDDSSSIEKVGGNSNT